MKKQTIILLLVLIFSAGVSANANNNAVVDERFELTSIVWRLAGLPEYNTCQVEPYVKAIDKHFKRYKDHPLIKHCEDISKTHSIRYDAISSTTAYLEIVDGGITLREGFSADSVANVESRWSPDIFVTYVELLDDFYKKSKFNKFYIKQKPIFDEAEKNFDKVVLSSEVGLQWFKSFFGEEPQSYKIILCINNGTSNYGNVNVPCVGMAAAVGGCFSLNSTVATYDSSTFHTLLHEFMHSFANPIAYKYQDSFAAASEKIYPHIAEELRRGAYGRSEIILEWLTRLSTIMYLKENGADDKVVQMIRWDGIQGFLWQADAVKLMDEFYADREKYPIFEAFVPRLIEFYNGVAENMESYKSPKVAEKSLEPVAQNQGVAPTVPEIVSICPAPNSVVRLRDNDTVTVTVKFSEPMQYTACAGPTSEYNEEKFIEIFTSIEGRGRYLVWVDKHTFTFVIPKGDIKKLKCNGIKLSAWAFVSENNIPIKEDVNINYTFKR